MRSGKARRSKDNGDASAATETTADSDKQRCPQCKDEDNENEDAALAKEDWVRCEGPCKTWYHWRCVGEGGDLEQIDKWYARRAVKFHS